MNILYQNALTLGDGVNLESVIDHAVELMRRELGVAFVDIHLVEEETGDLVHFGPMASPSCPERIPRGAGLVGWVATHQRAVRINDVREDDRVLIPDGWDGRSELAVPLICNGRTIAVVNAESRMPNAFSAEDETILVLITRQLTPSIVVMQQRLRRGLSPLFQPLPVIDSLFGHTLQAALDQAKPRQQPVTVMLFNYCNKRQKSLLGENASWEDWMAGLVTILDQTARDGELVARLRDDTFALLSLEAANGTWQVRGEAIINSVQNLLLNAGKVLPMGEPNLSFAVADSCQDGWGAAGLLAAATSRLELPEEVSEPLIVVPTSRLSAVEAEKPSSEEVEVPVLAKRG